MFFWSYINIRLVMLLFTIVYLLVVPVSTFVQQCTLWSSAFDRWAFTQIALSLHLHFHWSAEDSRNTYLPAVQKVTGGSRSMYSLIEVNFDLRQEDTIAQLPVDDVVGLHQRTHLNPLGAGHELGLRTFVTLQVLPLHLLYTRGMSVP